VSDFIDVVGTEGFDQDTMRQVKVDGHDLLVARVGDEFFAADAHCPHLHANLTKGTLEGAVVTCPLHGSRFDVRDGRCLDWTDWKGTAKNIATLVRHPRPLRVYEVRVESRRVLVGPQLAPPVE
jgi:3-phenylpropionate/trans-cinnamate dioxygenase ferredoxin subunit